VVCNLPNSPSIAQFSMSRLILFILALAFVTMSSSIPIEAPGSDSCVGNIGSQPEICNGF
jgi:hypothetical protein